MDTVDNSHAPAIIEVEVDTSLSAAHPSDSALTAAQVLEAEGIACGDGFQIVSESLPESNVCVSVAVADEAIGRVRDIAASFDAEVRYVPLLLRAVASALRGGKRSIKLALFVTETNLYTAAACRGELLFCDAFEYRSEDDLRYIASTLNGDFDLRDADTVVAGEARRSAMRTLKHNFKHIKCE